MEKVCCEKCASENVDEVYFANELVSVECRDCHWDNETQVYQEEESENDED